MKNFIEKYFTVIVLIIVIFTFFKGCNDSREISKIRKEFAQLRDSVATKTDIKILNEKVYDLQNTIWGSMDSYSFMFNKLIDESVDRKVTNKAFDMYSKKAIELNREKK